MFSLQNSFSFIHKVDGTKLFPSNAMVGTGSKRTTKKKKKKKEKQNKRLELAMYVSYTFLFPGCFSLLVSVEVAWEI